MSSPGVKRFPVQKRGIVMIANMIPVLGLSGADLGDEVSVHDYIC